MREIRITGCDFRFFLSFFGSSPTVYISLPCFTVHCVLCFYCVFLFFCYLSRLAITQQISATAVHVRLMCRYLFASSYVERVITDTGPTYRETNNVVRRSDCEFQEETSQRFNYSSIVLFNGKRNIDPITRYLTFVCTVVISNYLVMSVTP